LISFDIFKTSKHLDNQNFLSSQADYPWTLEGVFLSLFPDRIVPMSSPNPDETILGILAAKPPAFVYAIIPTIFVFFNIFASNMLLQYKKVGKWKEYLYGERGYIILRLVAKMALAWQIFAGTLAPV
jgi:hypothetical protein